MGGVGLPPYRAQLLSDTRGVQASQLQKLAEDLKGFDREAVDAMVAQFAEVMADRPVEVRVTSVLDGRQVAQSVYKDVREQRVKNYETL